MMMTNKFLKISVHFQISYIFKTKIVNPIYFCISDRSNSLPTSRRSLIKLSMLQDFHVKIRESLSLLSNECKFSLKLEHQMNFKIMTQKPTSQIICNPKI